MIARILVALVLAFGLALQSPAQWTPVFAPSIAEVDLAALPPEARETVRLIHKNGPFPYARDGITFSNREGLLPAKKRGYYREYTVKTPGDRTRGARRIVSGSADHYQSMRRIRE